MIVLYHKHSRFRHRVLCPTHATGKKMKPEPIVLLCILGGIIACLLQYDAEGLKVAGVVIAIVIVFLILERRSEIKADRNQPQDVYVSPVENPNDQYEAMLANSRNIQFKEALNIAKEQVAPSYVIQNYVEEYTDFFGFYYGDVNSEAYHPGLPEFKGWDGSSLTFFVNRHTGEIKYPPYPYKVQEGEMLLIHSSTEIESGIEAKNLTENEPIKIWCLPVSK